jgi:hypothetical protein
LPYEARPHSSCFQANARVFARHVVLGQVAMPAPASVLHSRETGLRLAAWAEVDLHQAFRCSTTGSALCNRIVIFESQTQ